MSIIGYPMLSIIYPQRWGVRVHTINWTLLDKRLTTESFCKIGKELTELITFWVSVGDGGFLCSNTDCQR